MFSSGVASSKSERHRSNSMRIEIISLLAANIAAHAMKGW